MRDGPQAVIPATVVTPGDAMRHRRGIGAVFDVELDRLGARRMSVPAGTSTIRLVSEARFGVGDMRRLGVAISEITLDGVTMALTDRRLQLGFHAAEGAWRWTDGAGCIAIEGLLATAELMVVVVALAPIMTAEQLAEARGLTAGFFDEAYYLTQNPDLTLSEGDALLHFLVRGYREGLNPGPDFDVAFYLESSADVAASGQNPLLHFILHGAAEGRLAKRPSSLWRGELDRGWASRQPAPIPRQPEPVIVTVSDLTATLSEAAGPSGLALVLSHDDYASSTGGVQNAVGDELVSLQRAGWGHLHLSPLAGMLRLATPSAMDQSVMRVRLDAGLLGWVRLADLVVAVRRLADRGQVVVVIVHHLAGCDPDHVFELIAAAAPAKAVVWVHDFFTLCSSHALMRNNIAYCGAPPAGSMACAICCHGAGRPEHVGRLRRFFDRVRPDVLAPSASALEAWRRIGFAHHHVAVVPLARLELGPKAASARADEALRCVRVAHLGGRNLIKGWEVFERLLDRHTNDARYEFFQMGVQGGAPARAGLQTVGVEVQAHDRSAMVRAVSEHDIDVVICWSMCSETFCFTAHEALAGGAFVIARRDAGNVWPAVASNAPDQGIALDTEAELFALFAGNDLADLLSRPRLQGTLVPGRGSVDWLDGTARCEAEFG